MIRLSFRTKTNAVFALALLAAAGVGFLSIRETAQLVEGEKWVSHTREVLEASASLSSHLSEAIAARRGYLLSGNPQEPDRFAKASDAARIDLNKLLGLTTDNPAQQERLHALEPLVGGRLATLKQSIELRQRGGARNDTDAQAAMSRQGFEFGAQIAELQQGFHDAESKLLIQRVAVAASTVRRTFRIEAILAASFLAVLIAALAFINREISLRERAQRASKEAERLMRSVLDSSSDAIMVADHEGNITLWNAAMARYYIKVPHDVPLERWSEEFGFFRRDKKTPVPIAELPLVRAALYGESIDNTEVYIQPAGWETGRWHLASARPLLDPAGRLRGGIVVLRDFNERKFLEEDRERLLVELYKSLEEVKTLTGLLPICAGCKKIRDDQGSWTHVEDYIVQHSAATFTHGLCPDCVSGLYPEVASKSR